ncbi:MAG: Na+/H+ antiporter NhaC family protein [Peptococcaceae bacterium]|nr:Na+/H+ antiporter NhaC family protein [Peptococcaceae bacterium]
MLEKYSLALIVAGLILSTWKGIDVIYPLTGGLVLLCLVLLYKGMKPKELRRILLLDMNLPVQTIYIFLMIGAVTALWRACGTIPMIIAYGAAVIEPRLFILFCFWLAAFVSMVLGTAFGTTGTIGLTMIVMAKAGGVNLAMTAGAIISGAFVGDQASPMSSSTNLIAIMTKTPIHRLISRLIRKALLPFAIASAGFALLSWKQPLALAESGLVGQMKEAFFMNPWILLPAVTMLILMLLRLRIEKAITASCLVAALIAWRCQGMAPLAVLKAALAGYSFHGAAELGAVLDGGGILDMLSSTLIVILSAAYSGILKGTNMLDKVKELIRGLGGKWGRTVGVTAAAFLVCLFSPSQVLAVMLTAMFSEPMFNQEDERERELLAYGCASTAMMFSSLVPWNICCIVPAAMLGMRPQYLLFNFYPMILPLCYMLRGRYSWRKNRKEMRDRQEYESKGTKI